MNETDKKRISKFLSLILRHNPATIGLILDDNGWADVEELIEKSKLSHQNFTVAQLEEVVVTNDKQRFGFNEDRTKIRANQGHSLKTVDLELKAIQPPEFLYHGTVARFIESIQKQGLQKQSRQHVHLSGDIETAVKVGSRRGKPIVLCVNAIDLHNQGHSFYLSKNGVWLTGAVPSEFIDFKEKK
ncbi:RNA 2'-phosphotransferase [Olleya sp. HaHaR_3_96]|uniref:RNA 2'-phosphotransferase n=1 Tax=Olleya sp. HaHaR_3_96 TaxID=2745560 RepID=UPI001C4E651A|nr:RNA 2'-phosphotransferase [Olleya sp. HaHaR_3_96]QXP61077.1 RNA 2'-phosphotransferase [Olleya sp. HaHaR_3_96]